LRAENRGTDPKSKKLSAPEKLAALGQKFGWPSVSWPKAFGDPFKAGLSHSGGFPAKMTK
jgi:hypothetical protein